MARRKKPVKRPAAKKPAAKPKKAPAKKRTVAKAATATPSIEPSFSAPGITGTPPIPYAPGYRAPREAQAKPSGSDPPNRTPLIQYSGKTMGVTGTVIDKRVTAMKQLRATHIKTPRLVRRKSGKS